MFKMALPRFGPCLSLQPITLHLSCQLIRLNPYCSCHGGLKPLLSPPFNVVQDVTSPSGSGQPAGPFRGHSPVHSSSISNQPASLRQLPLLAAQLLNSFLLTLLNRILRPFRRSTSLLSVLLLSTPTN